MSLQPYQNTLKKNNCLQFNFSTPEINVARLIASHWQKMYACFEIDRGEPVGFTFLTIWSPSVTLSKIEKQPSFKSSALTHHHYAVGDLGAQMNAPLTRWELEMLTNMVTAAVEGRLNRFLLMDKGMMNDVVGAYLTQSWTCNRTAIELAKKLAYLNNYAGLFDGHSAYQTAIATIERMQGVEHV